MEKVGRKERDMMKNIELEDGLALLLGEIKELTGQEQVSLLESKGRILSEDINAPLSQPPFDRSPLDGYALKGEDSSGASRENPVVLKVVEEVCAGGYSHRELQSGEAIRIMTGAPMPKGSNCVIRQEDTNEDEVNVALYAEVKPYGNYCYAGEDFKEGQLMLTKGTLLDAAHIGLLASMGMTKILVKSRVRVALLSTGDELVDPGKPLGNGKIYNSNLYTLAIRLQELGCEPIILGTSGDDIDVTVDKIKEVIDEVDFFITTGGVSVGKKDILHPVTAQLGAKRLFWRLKLKPGTPALATVFKSKVILSLSGNPSAAFITFELLFRDLLAKMTGCNMMKTKKLMARMRDDFLKRSPNRRFLRAYYEDGEVSLINNNHSSGVLSSMIGCNCMIDIEAGVEGLKAGDTVPVVVYR